MTDGAHSQESLTPSIMNLMAVGFKIYQEGKGDYMLRYRGDYWSMDVYEDDGWYVNLTGALPKYREIVEGKQAFEKPEDGVIKALDYLLPRCMNRDKTRNQIQTMIVSLSRQTVNAEDSVSERYQHRIKTAMGRYIERHGK